MKFYSEKLDALFDTLEQLEAEELALTKKPSRKKAAVKAEVKPEQPATPTRKELAAEVELADDKVKEAYAAYEAAKLKAEELSKKYLEEINAIIEPAEKAIKVAEQKRYEAIQNFNKNFGAYQVTYTGAKAADELVKALNNINRRADTIFRDLFWF